VNADGTRTPAVRDPEGRLCPDVRESETARPDWVADPFIRRRRDNAPPESPLATTFRAFQALTQRGKGGVYKAFDLSASPPRLCILKEGRAGGELAWDSRDGSWRIRHEERVLISLREAGVAVPRVYSSFEDEGNYYLVTELIDGETLQALLYKRRRRLSLSHALLYGARLSSLISRIHSAGWVWRDCKPANIVVTKGNWLRPLDFEGACPVEQPDPTRWSTPGFTPPAPSDEVAAQSSGLHEDLYALGAVVYLLLTGRLPEPYVPVEKLRRNVPVRVGETVTDLLSADPRRQPGASAVEAELKEAVSALREPRRGLRLSAPMKHVSSRAGRLAGV
jgi:serine/threonine protein kinase